MGWNHPSARKFPFWECASSHTTCLKRLAKWRLKDWSETFNKPAIKTNWPIRYIWGSRLSTEPRSECQLCLKCCCILKNTISYVSSSPHLEEACSGSIIIKIHGHLWIFKETPPHFYGNKNGGQFQLVDGVLRSWQQKLHDFLWHLAYEMMNKVSYRVHQDATNSTCRLLALTGAVSEDKPGFQCASVDSYRVRLRTFFLRNVRME